MNMVVAKTPNFSPAALYHTPFGCLRSKKQIIIGELLDWSGESALQLQAGSRYLIVVGAICTRRCGILDTDRWILTPHHW